MCFTAVHWVRAQRKVNSYLRLCYLDRTTGYAEHERKQVRLSRCRASDRALTVRETIYFTLEETAVKRLSAGTRKLLIACVLSARILDLHTTQDWTLQHSACSRSPSMPCIHLVTIAAYRDMWYCDMSTRISHRSNRLCVPFDPQLVTKLELSCSVGGQLYSHVSIQVN